MKLPPARTRPLATLLLLAPALLLASCATRKTPPPPVTLTGDPLADTQAQLAAAPARDKPLWQYRLATTALRHDRPDIAKTNLDAALAATTATATTATAIPDATYKPAQLFTGAPYERIMANYYRALLYWADGDLASARYHLRVARLPSAAPAASTPITEIYANDCILLDYLDGLLTLKLAPQDPGAAADALARARANALIQNRPPLPDYDPAANVFILVEYGAAPLKQGVNDDGKARAYTLPENTCQLARLAIAGQTIDLAPIDDLAYQAITHDSDFMDKFLPKNSSIKGALGDTAAALWTAGMAIFRSGQTDGNARVNNNANNGKTDPYAPLLKNNKYNTPGAANGELYAMLAAVKYGIETTLMISSTPFGIASTVIPGSKKPVQSDTRCWDNLPRFLSFAALKLPPGAHDATLTFYAPDGAPLPRQTQHLTITVPDPAALPAGARPKDTVIIRGELRN